MSRKEALAALLEKVEAGGVLQSNETSAVWPSTYNPTTGKNITRWKDACEASQGSLDAAKALHEAVLPGWTWELGPAGCDLWPLEEYGNDPVAWSSVAPESAPARAWLIAILKALIAESDQ